MRTTQMFTPLGVLGVALFIAGPIVSGWGLWLALGEPAARAGLLPVALIGSGSFASLVAIPMMLVGREYHRRDQ